MLAFLIPGAHAGPPNVILVLHDALRADVIGAYGADPSPSPALDRFASRGVVFERAIAQNAWTIPSVASLFTGVDPQAHRTLRMYREEDRVELDTLSSTLKTIAEQFQQGGYHTAALLKSQVMGASAGYDQGFQTYEVLDRPDAHGESAAQLTDRAIGVLTEADTPIFLYLHYMDVHSPYMAPEPHYSTALDGYTGTLTGRHVEVEKFQKGKADPSDADLKALKALYDAELRYWDGEFGRLLTHLASTGALENTVIAVVGDHGEAFGEHGQYFHGDLYQENIHVPMVLRGPGITPARVKDGVEVTDLGPTLCGLAGVGASSSWTGRNLTPLVQGKGLPSRPQYSEYRDYQTIIDKNLKLIVGYQGGPQLYDLGADPGEVNNLAKTKPDEVKRLKDLLAARRKGAEPVADVPAPRTITPAQCERLKALGYLETCD